jgi:hypothetical protein
MIPKVTGVSFFSNNGDNRGIRSAFGKFAARKNPASTNLTLTVLKGDKRRDRPERLKSSGVACNAVL